MEEDEELSTSERPRRAPMRRVQARGRMQERAQSTEINELDEEEDELEEIPDSQPQRREIRRTRPSVDQHKEDENDDEQEEDIKSVQERTPRTTRWSDTKTTHSDEPPQLPPNPRSRPPRMRPTRKDDLASKDVQEEIPKARAEPISNTEIPPLKTSTPRALPPIGTTTSATIPTSVPSKPDPLAQMSTFMMIITGHIESCQGASKGITQYSGKSQLADPNKVIVWNMPLDLCVKSTNPFGWPQLAISVYGPDMLGRDVIRGYGAARLPIAPGSILQGWMAKISGAPAEYKDSTFVCGHEGRKVTRVVSAGVVKVQFNITSRGMAKFGYSENDFGVSRPHIC